MSLSSRVSSADLEIPDAGNLRFRERKQHNGIPTTKLISPPSSAKHTPTSCHISLFSWNGRPVIWSRLEIASSPVKEHNSRLCKGSPSSDQQIFLSVPPIAIVWHPAIHHCRCAPRLAAVDRGLGGSPRFLVGERQVGLYNCNHTAPLRVLPNPIPTHASMSMTMSQTIQAAQEHARYYVSNASNHLAGLKVEAPVAAALLDSRALWALGVVVALVLARIFTQKPKLPAGVKRLPRVPGMPALLAVTIITRAVAD